MFKFLKDKTVIVISHRNNNKKLFDERSKNAIPVLIEDKTKAIKTQTGSPLTF